MKIKLIKFKDVDINDLVQISKYDNDAGIDVKLLESISIEPFDTRTIPCGFGIELPFGTMAQMITRSSISKQNITIGNAPIDASYRGEIHMMVSNNTSHRIGFNKGERLAQLVVTPIVNIELVDELVSRDTNGLGSSGK